MFIKVLLKKIMLYLISLFSICVLPLVFSSDKIDKLPGLNELVTFEQYAGYVNIDKATDRNLFYWFVESQNDPKNDDLVLWLNGGPGCSSFNGFFEEQGPFYVKEDQTLGNNKYSWNRVANMIFLESPLGVGFSYSNNTDDYTTNDDETSDRSLKFLIGFFQKYPQFKENNFYITGESYAGHYIPDLVSKIIAFNKNAGSDKINLVGFAIGNPWTDSSIDNIGVIDYIYSHNLISNNTYHGILENCNFTGQPYVKKYDMQVDPKKCSHYSQKMHKEQGNINAYDIYTDVCTKSGSTEARTLHQAWQKSNVPLHDYAKHLLDGQRKKLNSPYDPCIDNYLIKYLNNPDVQKSIHARKPDVPWAPCASRITFHYSQTDVAASKLYRYSEILGQGLRAVIYSGDVDSVVPTTGTRMWLNVSDVKISREWEPWVDSASQVGGYTIQYDKLLFATVRNAGHEVPSFQPLRAYDLFTKFILKPKEAKQKVEKLHYKS